jgi:hypothetical protein
MTRKLNIDRAYSDTVDRRPAGNSGFKKLAVQWLQEVQFSDGTFVVTDSLVLRNRQLLKPAKRQAVKKPLFSFVLSNSTIFKTDFRCLFAF